MQSSNKWVRGTGPSSQNGMEKPDEIPFFKVQIVNIWWDMVPVPMSCLILLNKWGF